MGNWNHEEFKKINTEFVDIKSLKSTKIIKIKKQLSIRNNKHV